MYRESFREDPRYAQTRKETIVVLLLLVANIIWWFAFAYGLGSRPPQEYSYVMGFPAWFFWSCIASLFVFSLLVVLVIPAFFKDIPFDETERRGGS